MTCRAVGSLAATVALLLAAAGRAPAADSDRLRFQRAIELPARQREELVAVPLDGAVYAATGESYADLRVLDADDRDVPRVVRATTVARSRRVRESRPAGRLAARPLADGRLEVEFTVAAEPPPPPIHGLRIVTPLVDFEQSVEVQKRGADGVFGTIGGPALLYDYARFVDSRSVEIALAEPDRGDPAGTWRLVFADPTVEQRESLTVLVRTLEEGREARRDETTAVERMPFRIDAIELWHDRDEPLLRAATDTEVPLSGWQVDEEDGGRVTRLRVRSDRTPVTRFRIDVADRNFSRPVRVEIPAGGGASPPGRPGSAAPRIVAEGRVARVDLRGIDRDDPSIGLPESRAGAYELRIANGDSPPLTIAGVSASGPAREAVFLARPGGRYRLAYGAVAGEDGGFPAPRFDTASIDIALSAGEAPVAGTLGPAVDRPVVPASAPVASRLLADPWIVGGVILGLAVILAASLHRAARRLDAAAASGDGER